MNGNGGLTELHLTRLATWAVNTLGKAIAVSVLVAFVGGIAAGFLVVSGAPPGLAFGLVGLAAPISFAAVLYNANAPLPNDP